MVSPDVVAKANTTHADIHQVQHQQADISPSVVIGDQMMKQHDVSSA